MLKQSSSRKLTSPGYFSSQGQAVDLDFEKIYQELSGFCGNIIRGLYPTKPSKLKIPNAPADEDLVEVRFLDDHILYIEGVEQGHYLQLDSKQITPLDLNTDYIFPFGGYGAAGQKLKARIFQFVAGPKSNISGVRELKGMKDDIADNMAYVPRNSLLLCGMDNKVYSWDLNQEQPLMQDFWVCQGKVEINSVVCNGDDKVAIGQDDDSIVIIEAATKKELCKFEGVNTKQIAFKGDWICFEDDSEFDGCFPPNLSQRLIVINLQQRKLAKVFGVGKNCNDKCLYTNDNGTYLIYSESSSRQKVNKVIVIDVATGYSSSIYLDEKFAEMAKAIIPAHKKASPDDDHEPNCNLVEATNWGVAIKSDEWVIVIDIEPVNGKHIQSLLPQVEQGEALFNSLQNRQKVKHEWAMPSSPCRIIPYKDYLLASDGHNLRPISYFEGDTITNEVLIPNIDPKYMALKDNNYLYIGQENNLTIYKINDINGIKDVKYKILPDANDWKQSMIYITDQQDNPESLFISFNDKLIRVIYICSEQSLDIPIKYIINDVFLYEDHDIQNFKLLVACEAGIIQVIFDKSLRMPPDIQRAIVLRSAPEKLSKGSNIFAIGLADASVQIWDLDKLQCLVDIADLYTKDHIIAIRDQFLITELPGHLYLYHLPTKQLLTSISTAGKVNDITISPDLTTIIYSTENDIHFIRSPLLKDNKPTLYGREEYKILFYWHLYLIEHGQNTYLRIFNEFYMSPQNYNILSIYAYQNLAAFVNKALENNISIIIQNNDRGDSSLSIAAYMQWREVAENIAKKMIEQNLHVEQIQRYVIQDIKFNVSGYKFLSLLYETMYQQDHQIMVKQNNDLPLVTNSDNFTK